MIISRYLIFSLLLCCAGAALFSGCTDVDQQSIPLKQPTSHADDQESINDAKTTWITIPITDAITGKQTTIADLATSGKPIIIHTFAVWCPACSIQLRETAKLVQSNPDAYTILGIDIDPRENAELVQRHIEKNQLTGMYVAAPPEMTRSLMDTIGDQIIRSLPQTIIICNKSVTYIGDGVFAESRLETILSELCQ
jgi:thiol-disulfide isomerase/thioredoxin